MTPRIDGVVVGVDGSAPSADAVRWAVREATYRDCPVQAVTAWYPSGDPSEVQWLGQLRSVRELKGAVQEQLLTDVAAAVESLGEIEVPIVAEARYGHPVLNLVDAAGEHNLLVTGSRGRNATEGLVLGSASQGCAEYARSCVVVVRGITGSGRVVVGVDGSPESLTALRFAAEAALLRRAQLQVVHAWTDPAVPAHRGVHLARENRRRDEAKATLESSLRRGLTPAGAAEATTSLIEGAAHTALLEAAQGAELLVVGARGRGGWKALLLGSVSLRCLTRSSCPVAVVRGEASD